MVNKRYEIEIEKLKFLISENKLIGNELIKYIDDKEFINHIHRINCFLVVVQSICDNI